MMHNFTPAFTLTPAIKKLFPFQSHFLKVRDGVMHYVDEGSGPVVVLLHGNPTWSFYFRELIKVLAPHFRLIAPDFIGMGLSERRIDRRFRAIDRVEQVEEFLAQLGIEKFSLVMHDWGGSIGTRVAVRSPEKIERLVYLNTTLTETESLPLIIKLAAAPLTGKFLTCQTSRFVKVTTEWGVSRKLPKDVKQGYFLPYRRKRDRTAIWDFVADIPFDSDHPTYIQMMELAEALPSFEHIPVQIVWGLRDPCFHREMLNKVAEHFPQARVLEIPEASHLVLEDAQEVACGAILEFFTAPTEQLQHEVQERLAKRRQHALVAALDKHAHERPRADATIEPLFLGNSLRYAHTNFRALRQLVNKYERGLVKLGLTPGDRVLMLVPGGMEFLALSYALMARGATPFYLDPGMGRENLYRCIEEISPDVFIGSPKAHLLRWFRRKLFAQVKFNVMVSEWIFWRGTNLSFLKKFASMPIPSVTAAPQALVAYTSGGTGRPKGVIYTNEMLEAQLKILTEDFGLKAGTRDLPLLPIFSLFQLGCGVCSVFPPMDASRPLAVDPLKIVRMVNDLGIESSFGSPTLWNKISEYCIRSKEKLPSLARIFMAGAPVSRQILQRVHQVAPNVLTFTPYGATEALPVTLISGEEILNRVEPPALSGEVGTLVGKAVPGVELRVIKSIDGPIHDLTDTVEQPPYVIGEVIVKGPNVSTAYYRLNDGRDSGKIPEGQTLWHRMGDMGYLDEEGYLYFCGRKAHIVPTKERIYYSVPVERVFNQHPKVKRSALIAVGNDREPAVAIEPLPHFWPESDGEKQAFETELREIAQNSSLTERIQKVYFHRSFPVDARHNAKIFRDKLGEWASQTADN